ncbi:MAG: MoaD/ThiS family protein [Gammaproteobacteria bacterium]|nr:MoaD/ThiS family protein [Gammaproteobacteria bacterium]MCP5459301.1 MoaD/ThiS family protein [Gammaproteobacteria bacterium]
MQITLKLYATLSEFLPPGAVRNVKSLDVPEAANVASVIKQLSLPQELVHLVLVNGVYIPPETRVSTMLNENDALAIWPPVAGG